MLAFSEILKRQFHKGRRGKNIRNQIIEKFIDIILIVVSVYIALLVENWAQRRHDKERLHQYYNDFVTEIQKDIDDLKSVTADAEKHITNFKNHVKFIKQGGPADSILNYFIMSRSVNFFINSSLLSYKSMMASGDIKLVENLKVREALLDLDMKYSGLKIQEEIYLDFISKELRKFYSDNFDLLSGNPLKSDFYKQSGYRNIVVISLGMNQARLKSYKDALEKAKKTLEILKKEQENK